jgi:DNA-binding response OmpR family regulator
MTRDGLQRALLDLGWISLTQRALGIRPAEAYALRQLTRRPGTPVTLRSIADEYGDKGGFCTGSDDAIRKRVERVRTALSDVGCEGAIQTIVGAKAYVVEPRDARRIENAVLYACGIEISEAA